MREGLAVVHNQVAGVAEGERLQQSGDDEEERGDARPQIREEENIDQREAEDEAAQQELREDRARDDGADESAVAGEGQRARIMEYNRVRALTRGSAYGR